MQEHNNENQNNMMGRPNLPADDYWINNNNNSFRKQNSYSMPKTKKMPTSTPRNRYTGMQSGTMPQPPGELAATERPMRELPRIEGPDMPPELVEQQQELARCGNITDTSYIQGYLKTQIGQQVKITFLIGTNMLVDREGTLVEVGIDYLIINEVRSDDYVLCDLYSIKFVKIYY